MARRKGSFGLWLLQWVIIPFGLAAIGFYVIGPRIGEEMISRKQFTKETAPTIDPTKSEKEHPEPKVRVSSRPVDE